MEEVFFLFLVRDFFDGLFEDFHEGGVDSAEDEVFEVGVLWYGFGFFELANCLAEEMDVSLEVVLVVFEQFSQTQVHFLHPLDKKVLMLDDEVVELNEFSSQLLRVGMAVELVVGVAIDWVFVQKLSWKGLHFFNYRNELLHHFVL